MWLGDRLSLPQSAGVAGALVAVLLLFVFAVVGYEPHLSTLITWLISGVEEPRVELKKGGACLLELDGTPGPAAARLVWRNAPRALRQLAG